MLRVWAHQIANSSIHSFYAARGSWKMQFWIFPIGSEMVYSPEKLSNDHAHDTQSCCLPNKTPQFFEHVLQPWTIGEIESFSDILVKRFAQSSALQSAIASAAAVLQAADKMKVAELHGPAVTLAKPDNSGNLVGDRGSDPSVYPSRDGRDRLRPTLHVFSAFAQHRIEKYGSILMAWLHGHLVQDPVFFSKPEVKSVQNQDQRPSRNAQSSRTRYERLQASTKTPAQAPIGNTVAWGESFQRAAVQQHCFQNSSPNAPRFAAAPFLANSPRPLALTALTTSRTEVVNFGSATRRFRVARMHARELDTDSRSKYPETQVNSV
jgi:hypothetical protein